MNFCTRLPFKVDDPFTLFILCLHDLRWQLCQFLMHHCVFSRAFMKRPLMLSKKVPVGFKTKVTSCLTHKVNFVLAHVPLWRDYCADNVSKRITLCWKIPWKFPFHVVIKFSLKHTYEREQERRNLQMIQSGQIVEERGRKTLRDNFSRNLITLILYMFLLAWMLWLKCTDLGVWTATLVHQFFNMPTVELIVREYDSFLEEKMFDYLN